MIIIISITGFYRHNADEVKDNSVPLLVNSSGHYRLVKLNYLETTRLNGRPDYQILYMTRGTGHFFLQGKYQPITAGHIIIYYPGEPQFYYYRLDEQPEVYWIHFTGYQSEELMKQYHLWGNSVLYIGIQPNLISLFNNVTHEIQLRQKDWKIINTLTLQQICLLISRNKYASNDNFYRRQNDLSSATIYIHENYQSPIVIRELAQQYHMTYNWFIRCFKNFTGLSPQAYLTNVRIVQAQGFLANPSLSISEIAELVGYTDPLYFSRIFKKQTGYSPKEYRKRLVR